MEPDGTEGSPPDVSEDTKPHTVIFKSIGATRDDSYQAALKAARDKMESGEDVPVIMEPEPVNIWTLMQLFLSVYLMDTMYTLGMLCVRFHKKYCNH